MQYIQAEEMIALLKQIAASLAILAKQREVRLPEGVIVDLHGYTGPWPLPGGQKE